MLPEGTLEGRFAGLVAIITGGVEANAEPV